MITVNKKDVGNWLLIEYLADLHVVREKIRFFEKNTVSPGTHLKLT